MGDNLLTTLGHAPAFGVKANPLGWLEDIASKWVPVAALLRHEGLRWMPLTVALLGCLRPALYLRNSVVAASLAPSQRVCFPSQAGPPMSRLTCTRLAA